MKIKNYINFINEEADELTTPAQPAAAAQTAPAQPAAQSGTTETPSAQSGTTETAQSQSTEQKSGDLSNYNNESATKFPDTVKKMVDLMKDMDKGQLIKLRTLIAEIKSINDAKNEIGKL